MKASLRRLTVAFTVGVAFSAGTARAEVPDGQPAAESGAHESLETKPAAGGKRSVTEAENIAVAVAIAPVYPVILAAAAPFALVYYPFVIGRSVARAHGNTKYSEPEHPRHLASEGSPFPPSGWYSPPAATFKQGSVDAAAFPPSTRAGSPTGGR